MTSSRLPCPHRLGQAAVAALALCLAVPATAQLATTQTADGLKRPGIWAQSYVDRPADPDVRFGQLANGMRYAIRRNTTPPGATSLRLWIGAGSLAEREDQRGLAHFLEHMAFRGSTHVPTGDLVRILQRLGLAFGADTNAHTGLDETVYKFDLPQSDRETIDTGLMLLREVASELTLAQTEMDPERGVVLSEERLRDSPSYRQGIAELLFQLDGQLAPRRMPIGAVEIIRDAPVALMREFYEAHYRPDNAAIVAVGDFDVADMEIAIRARFGGWAAKIGVPSSPNLGTVRPRGPAVRVNTEPGTAPSLSITWARAYDATADTAAQGRHDLANAIAMGVLNKRLDRLEQAADAPFLSASAGASNVLRSAHLARLRLQPKPEAWAAALESAIAEQRRLVEFGVRPEEMERVMTEYRTAMRIAADGAATRGSNRIADTIVQAISGDDVYSSPAQDLAEVTGVLTTLGVGDVDAAARRLFAGSGPLVFVGGPTPIAGGEAAVASVLTAALARPIAAGTAEAVKSWPYTPAATPGLVAARAEIADLGVTDVTFANGVRLLVKTTDFAGDEVLVRVRIGTGRLGIGPEIARATWQVSGTVPLLRLGGTRELTYEDIQVLTAANRVAMNLSLDDDAYMLSGTTRPVDLDMQLQLLQAYTTNPGLRAPAFARMQASVRSRLPQIEATASGVFSRELALALHGGDQRWQRVPDAAALAASGENDLAALIGQDFATGPITIAIVGDIDAARAIAAVARGYGALPARLARPPGATTPVRLADAGKLTVPHGGRADQAVAMAAWPTDDFHADPQTQRVLGVTAAILRSRLTEQLRATDGVTYSPSVEADASRVFKGIGYLTATVETRLDKVDSFFTELDRIVIALQAAPPSPDELDRARRPMLDRRIKLLRENAYWVGILSAALGDIRMFDTIRNLVSGTERVTADDVVLAARRFLTGSTQFRMIVRPANE